MPTVNHFVGVGRLTRDPERNGPALKFAIAIDRYGKDAGADFIDCVVFEKLADQLAPMLGKGRQVAVEGRLKHSTWTSDQGAKRSKIEVVAFNVQVLDKPKQEAGAEDDHFNEAGDVRGQEESDGDAW